MTHEQIMDRIEKLKKKLQEPEKVIQKPPTLHAYFGKIRRDKLSEKLGNRWHFYSNFITEMTRITYRNAVGFSALTEDEVRKYKSYFPERYYTAMSEAEIQKNQELYFSVFSDLAEAIADVIKKYEK